LILYPSPVAARIMIATGEASPRPVGDAPEGRLPASETLTD
jgi:hypothetical protein